MRQTVLRYLDRQLEVDARSLGAGRIAIGLLLLYDLGVRATDLTAHYTDDGVLPRVAFQLRHWSFTWSLHEVAGSPGFEAALFVLGALLGAAFTAGAYTRFATVGSFLFALSIQGRNPFLHDGQDDLLRVVLFFSLFLPLGQSFSIDAWLRNRRKEPTPPMRVSGIRTLGLAGQLAIMYSSSVIGKLQSAWWTRGDGILRALQLGRYETHAGRWLAQFPGFLHPMTFGVLALEAALPLLLFAPPWPLANERRRGLLRAAAVSLGLALHLGFGIFLRLSIFPALAIATWGLFVPGWIWERELPGASATSPQPTEPLPGRPAALASVFLVLAALYVVGTHRYQPILPDLGRRLVETLGLQQYWVVFAPRNANTTTDGYFVAQTLRADSEQVDQFAHDGPVTFEPPAYVSETFANTRWRHFYANLVVEWQRGSAQYREVLAARQATAGWLCQDYDDRHPGQPKATRVSLVFVEHYVDRPDEVPTRRVLAQTQCPQ